MKLYVTISNFLKELAFLFSFLIRLWRALCCYIVSSSAVFDYIHIPHCSTSSGCGCNTGIWERGPRGKAVAESGILSCLGHFTAVSFLEQQEEEPLLA